MAFHRRRRGSYSTYRRRTDRPGVLKVLAVALVFAVCAALVWQTVRLREAGATIDKLQQQVKTLQAPKDKTDPAASPAGSATGGAQLSYQKLYPEMKTKTAPQFAENNPKAVYLTFDDGPSARTETILDALAAKNQKATFFVVGKHIAGREALLRRMVDEGHTIGIHGFSHDYGAVYQSVDAFLEDFHQAYQAVYEACGVYPNVLRFPGGSVNAYNRAVYQEIIAEMLRRGFVYYDWNVSGEDATGKPLSAADLVQSVTNGIAKNGHAIVLLHDAADKKTTAEAVPQLLEAILSLGYYADKLEPTVQPVTFGYIE